MDLLFTAGCLIGGLFGMMLTFYLTLCFICWIEDVWDKTTWRWKK